MSGYVKRSKNFRSMRMNDYLDELSDEGWDDLLSAGRAKADTFIGLAKARYSTMGGSQEIAAAGARVAKHIKRVDEGEEYRRKKVSKGTKMPVQLIVVHNAKASARKLEFGSGRRVPAFAVLRNLVAGMRGSM